jgi:hypothetical protein
MIELVYLYSTQQKKFERAVNILGFQTNYMAVKSWRITKWWMEDGQDPVDERHLNFCAHSARLLRKLIWHIFCHHVLLWIGFILNWKKKSLTTSNFLPLHLVFSASLIKPTQAFTIFHQPFIKPSGLFTILKMRTLTSLIVRFKN